MMSHIIVMTITKMSVAKDIAVVVVVVMFIIEGELSEHLMKKDTLMILSIHVFLSSNQNLVLIFS